MTGTEFIILHYTRVGETSVVLHTLSRDFGRRSFIVNVGKRVPASLFLPLNILEATVYESDKSTLWRASKLSSKHPLNGVRGDIRKNTMTLFMSEVLYRAVRDGACEDGLYDWCVRSILTLDAMESDFANFHIYFLLELAVALGFSPSAEDLAPFAGEYYSILQRFLSSSFGETMLIPLSGQVRGSLADIVLEYLSHHLECQLNIKSLAVLGELYR